MIEKQNKMNRKNILSTDDFLSNGEFVVKRFLQRIDLQDLRSYSQAIKNICGNFMLYGNTEETLNLRKKLSSFKNNCKNNPAFKVAEHSLGSL